MKYNLIIDRLANPRAANIIAHKLAGTLTISIQKAHSLLENMPLIYVRGCTKDEGAFELAQLSRIGVSGHLIEVAPENRTFKANFPKFQPEHVVVTGTEAVEQVHQPIVVAMDSAPTEQKSQSSIGSVQEMAKRVSPAFVGLSPVREKIKKQQQSRLIRFFIIGIALISVGLLFFFLAEKDKTLSQMVQRFMARMRNAQMHSLTPARSGQSASGKFGSTDSIWAKSDSAAFADSARAGLPIVDSAGQVERAGLTSAQKIESQNYIDSAAMSQNSAGEKTIYFYRMAIAFNKYNINAWYGLVTAYNVAGDTLQANQARTEMEKLFGEKVSAVRELISSYGTLIDLSLSPSGTYRIEYRSNANTPALLRAQAWQIIRAIAEQCNCSAISINASTASLLGSLVYCRLHPVPRSEKEFLDNADIRIFK